MSFFCSRGSAQRAHNACSQATSVGSRVVEILISIIRSHVVGFFCAAASGSLPHGGDGACPCTARPSGVAEEAVARAPGDLAN